MKTQKEHIIFKVKTKKDLQEILAYAKKELKEWADFIKLVEKKIKNKV